MALGLSSCGAGVAGVVASAGGDGGGSTPALTAFEVLEPKDSPTPLRLVATQAVRATFFFDAGQGERALTGLDGPGVSGNEASLPAGETLLAWDFSREPELPSTGLIPLLHLIAKRGGTPLPGGELVIDLGNDAPVVHSVQPVPTDPRDPGESSGNVQVRLQISDSSSDAVDVGVEWRRASDPPDAWSPVTAAGGFPNGIVTAPAPGIVTSFFWSTNVDLEDEEEAVFLRVTAGDRTAEGTPFVTDTALVIDNNDAPVATLNTELLITSPDETRGIAVSFTLTDEEGDPIRVVLQWRREEDSSFPSLAGLSRDELVALLDDPERAAERRQLQICTEQPVVLGGRLQPPPDDPAFDRRLQVTLPELAGSAASLLAGEGAGPLLAEKALEILRASQVPAPVAASWQANPLVFPVAALPVENGPTALVLDARGTGWTLIEIDLATGEVVEGHEASGEGSPTAMDDEPRSGAVVVASHDGEGWLLSRVDRRTWMTSELVSARDALDPTMEQGAIRGLLSLGTGTSVMSVGSSLVRADYHAGSPAQAVTLLDRRFATPCGLVADPLHANRIYLAERDFAHADGRVGRIVTVELDTYLVEEVFVRGDTPLGRGFERPTAIALEQNGARLLALTNADPALATRELRGTNLNGNEPGLVFELTDELPREAASIAVGPDRLRLVALPSAESPDLALGGGVEQRRKVERYDFASMTVSVAVPFAPEPAANAPWRIRDFVGVTRSNPEGVTNFFLWDTTDVHEGRVRLRITPLDTDVGLDDAGLAPKRVRSFSDPLVLGGAAVTRFPTNVIAADLNEDGLPDLATDAGDRAFPIFYQPPTGGFSTQPDLELAAADARGNSRNPAAVDLDGDGRLDLVTAIALRGLVEIFLQPDLGFMDMAPSDCVLREPLSDGFESFEVEPVDLDRDGLMDLAVANGDSIVLHRQNAGSSGSCGFPAQLTCVLGDPLTISDALQIRSGDVDSDGDLDLVVSNAVLGGASSFFTVLFNAKGESASCGFSKPDALVRMVPRSVFAADLVDLNRDGLLDVVAPFRTFSSDGVILPGVSGVAVFLQEGLGGQFPEQADSVLQDPSVDAPNTAILEDVNGDGRVDIVTSNFSSDNFTVFLQTPDGAFPPIPDVVLAAPGLMEQPFSSTTADLDGDGRLDLISANDESSTVTVFQQKSPGAFAAAGPDLALGTSTTTDRPTSISAGDLDGDGLVDLVSANSESSNVGVFFQASPGVFSQAPDRMLLGRKPTSVQAADVDGDADLDLVSANPQSDDITILEQLAPGSFAADPIALGSAGSTDDVGSVVCADLDGDGDIDVAAAGTNSIGIFYGRFTAGAPQPNARLGVGLPTSLCIADLDSDGDLDLGSANQIGNNLRLFLNPGGGFSGQEGPRVLGGGTLTRGPQSILAEDLDGDGYVDIASANVGAPSIPRSVTIFFQVAGEFDPQPLVIAPPRAPHSLAAADFDLDGDLDLVLACADPGNELAMYTQTSPGRFVASQDIPADGPVFVRAADWNSDGEPDLAAALQRPVGPSGTFSDLIAIFFNGR